MGCFGSKQSLTIQPASYVLLTNANPHADRTDRCPDVGKTSILCKFAYNEFPFQTNDMPPEISITFKSEGKVDTGGTEKFRTVTKSYYEHAHGVIMVFDLCDASTFTDLTGPWLSEVQRYSNNSRKILVGNKSDCESKRQVDSTEAQKWADKFGFGYIEASAKLGTNIQQIFEALAKEIYEEVIPHS